MSDTTPVEPEVIVIMTPELHHAITVEVAALQATYPDLAGPIGRGNAVLMEDRFCPALGGTWALVESRDKELQPVFYRTVAVGDERSCTCPDATHHPDRSCKHRTALVIYQRAMKRLAVEEAIGKEDALGTSEDQSVVPPHVPQRFIQYLHGKPYIRYAGLLFLAQQAGLLELHAEITLCTADLAVAKARAVFRDGRAYSASADATPTNVTPQIRPHFPRMAETRAKARALRDALGFGGLCAAEEVE